MFRKAAQRYYDAGKNPADMLILAAISSGDRQLAERIGRITERPVPSSSSARGRWY